MIDKFFVFIGIITCFICISFVCSAILFLPVFLLYSTIGVSQIVINVTCGLIGIVGVLFGFFVVKKSVKELDGEN